MLGQHHEILAAVAIDSRASRNYSRRGDLPLLHKAWFVVLLRVAASCRRAAYRFCCAHGSVVDLRMSRRMDARMVLSALGAVNRARARFLITRTVPRTTSDYNDQLKQFGT